MLTDGLYVKRDLKPLKDKNFMLLTPSVGKHFPQKREGEKQFPLDKQKAIFLSTLAFEKGDFKTFCKQNV